GTFTLTFDDNGTLKPTTPIGFNATALAVQQALVAATGKASSDIAVSSTTTAAGTVYTITFQNALGTKDIPALDSAGALQSGNEIQMISITGAAGGSYRLRFQYDANHNNTIDTREDVTSGAISATATAADVEAALAALPNIGKTGTVDNVAVAQFG